MEAVVVHHVPGRVRLRIAELRTAPDLSAWIKGPLGAQFGVQSFRVNSWCACVVIDYDPQVPRAVERILAALQFFSTSAPEREPVQQPAPTAARAGLLRRIVDWCLRPGKFVWSCFALGAALVGGAALPFATPLILASAVPSIARAVTVMHAERRLNVDFLDSLATFVSIGRGQFVTAAFITWMIALGDWIRDRTAARSKRVVTSLLEFQTKTAWVIRAGRIVRTPSNTIQAGETVIVYPGEIIPVDGRIVDGRATVDQKSITGESEPCEKCSGEEVFASTVLRDGKLSVRALRVGADTTAAQIVQLVESAPLGETRIQNYAERFGDRLVAPSLALSTGLFAATGNLDRLLSMLIIDYGTGIRVAAPTAVLAAIARAARHGILIKSGRQMERLSEVDTIVFDKTGTLTHGTPEIRDVISCDERAFPARKILALAAGAEARLNHPVSQALLAKAEAEQIEVPERMAVNFEIGLGVEARINGYHVHLGSERFFSTRQIGLGPGARTVEHARAQGCSTLLFAIDGVLKGVIPYADQIRDESRDVVRALQDRGIRVLMITGDHRRIASAVAARLGIDHCFAETLPCNKAELIQSLQREGHVVAMIGDGINDSPALAYADIGISVKHGADVARETADVVLMEDNLWKLISAIELSQNAIKTIRQNYAIIAILNTVALLLAIPPGLITPNTSALISNGSAILASLNAIRPILAD